MGRSRTTSRSVALLLFVAAANGATVTLRNSADPNVQMPLIGLGTGGYGSCLGIDNKTCCATKACWWSKPCPSMARDATRNWLQLGGLRIDSANSYDNDDAVGKGLRDARIPRDHLFITSKLAGGGADFPMGFDEVIDQAKHILPMEFAFKCAGAHVPNT